MRKITLALCISAALMGCTAEGRVDWVQVGNVAETGLKVVAVTALIVGTAGLALAASQPAAPVYYQPPPITCWTSHGAYTSYTTCN